jgi:hypothetical protein
MTDFPRSGERGGARLKFLIVVAILGAVGCAGYFYIPVAYNAYLYKDLMQTKVDAAAALGRPTTWVSDQLIKSGPDYEVPPDAVITPTLENDRVKVRVQFSRTIEFPGYPYTYQFDHTAQSVEFLGKKQQ